MAKKRVYELAKERGVSSKELLAALQAAGVDVKAAASTVDESEVLEKLAPASPDGDGRKSGAAATEPAEQPQAAKTSTPPRSGTAPEGSSAAPSRPAPEARPRSESSGPGKAPEPRSDGDAGRPRARPQRGAPAGRPPGASPGRRRRVVIDSQASRRHAPGPPPPQQQRRRRSRGRGAPPPEPQETTAPTAVVEAPAVKVPSGATVRDIAEHFGLQVSEVIKKLMQLGEMASITQTLSDEAIQVLADEFNRRVEVVRVGDEEEVEEVVEDADEDLVSRPPVVTVMGHVDHGKTSLLDAIRETEVVAGEAGGITQHIGAYQVHHGERIVTFLDTPGHEAFTAMRARGARATDVAVIVVAADDGVMPQTTEAIDHAKAAGVPMVIAVNKIDKEGAQPERVRNELAAQGLTPEEWGGETIYCDVSAKTKQGLDNLLDMILLVSDVEELRANPDAPASGVVIESRLDPGRGPVVTILVHRGTLRVGDAGVAGAHWGRIRAMHDFMGEPLEEAYPGVPVGTLGFDTVPDAGDSVRVVENDRKARQLAAERATRLKTEALARRQSAAVSLEDVLKRVREGKTVALNLILKADVAGSLEAIQDEIAKLPQTEVTVNVIHSAVGGISNSDVMLAAASGAVIIGFNVRPLPEANVLAGREAVDVRTYTVIYKLTEDLRAAMLGLLEPEEVEESLGMAEVRQTFKASRIGTIAGCHVTQGKIARNAKVRLLRDGAIIFDGSIGSLRRFKEDVREVEEGFECGIVLDGYQDVKQGDVLEAYATRSVERELQ